MRAQRVGALHDDLMLAAETDLAAVLTHIEQVNPRLIIVDSIRPSRPPTSTVRRAALRKVREVAGVLIRAAKQRGITTILVGHVTKDGSVAGPRTLEHLVDVVLNVEGDRHARLRLVRAQKNRFGPADEVGCFDLGDEGIRELSDPSELFVTRRHDPVSGTAITVAMEGTRPLVTEVQALVDPTSPGQARRATSGLDASRVAMVLAVLERRAGIGLKTHDTYTATVGGVKVSEPAADLAVAIAVASAFADKPVPVGTVIIGEVGLAGEVRRVTGTPRPSGRGCSAWFHSRDRRARTRDGPCGNQGLRGSRYPCGNRRGLQGAWQAGQQVTLTRSALDPAVRHFPVATQHLTTPGDTELFLEDPRSGCPWYRIARRTHADPHGRNRRTHCARQ